MLNSQEPAGTAEPRLDLVSDEQSPMFAAERSRSGQVFVGRDIHALALNGLDDERCDLTRTQRAIKRLEIVERHLDAVWQQRAEPFAEILVCR